MELTHLNKQGEAIMVDVGEKNITCRTAEAFAAVKMKPQTLTMLLSSQLKKGDGLAAARIAGIMAAKRTWELIPLCHNIPIESVEIRFENNGTDELYIYSAARCSYKTGIEMEALTAVSVAALTVYDMCKAVDRGMVISETKLLSKTGGKSDFKNEG
ncbi:MAG: cyclic pyranopterin monophosphate synthase MoaC [Clostridia bacterium]|nr:cyclic pyranopterin monophosphate synthase MoaC [Clostridia bacterium]